MPRPNSMSAPVDGVVVFAPRTLEVGTWLAVELDTDVVAPETFDVFDVDDSLLVVTGVVLSVDVLAVEDVVAELDEVVGEVEVELLDSDDVLCELDVVVLEELDVVPCEVDVVLCVLVVVVHVPWSSSSSTIVQGSVTVVVVWELVLVELELVCDVVVGVVDDVVEDDEVVVLESPAQVLERTKSPLPLVSSAAVPSASVLSSMIPASGTQAHERVTPPSASTTAALYPPSPFCWT